MYENYFIHIVNITILCGVVWSNLVMKHVLIASTDQWQWFPDKNFSDKSLSHIHTHVLIQQYPHPTYKKLIAIVVGLKIDQ